MSEHRAKEIEHIANTGQEMWMQDCSCGWLCDPFSEQAGAEREWLQHVVDRAAGTLGTRPSSRYFFSVEVTFA